jgi:methylphosphotriester-DNA--protein-cysteine methyltransferase
MLGSKLTGDQRIKKVLQIIENDQKRNIAGLASEVGLSVSRLEHLFKWQTGV